MTSRAVAVVHDGAGRVATERLKAHETGHAPTAIEALRALLAGGSALDPAQRTMRALDAEAL